VAGGVGIALAGHVLASGPWLFSLYTFVYYGTPDSLLLVDVVVLLLQLALFAGCLVVGIWLVVRRERGIGVGLLVGWAVGVVGLVLGTMAILDSVPSDVHAAAGLAAGLGTVPICR
jgi:hypothetical protein